MVGYNTKQKEKRILPPRVKIKVEKEEANPWGKFLTPALQKIIDERRQKEKSNSKNTREESNSTT